MNYGIIRILFTVRKIKIHPRRTLLKLLVEFIKIQLIKMDDFKQKIYTTFDKEGIKLKPISKFSLAYDEESNEIHTGSGLTYLPYEPQKEQFNLTDEEFFDTVIDYIYDTTSLRINKMEELENYPSINNLPFILKINEYDNDATIFALAFGKIPGSVIVRKEHKILSLGNIEEVDGTLGLSKTSISSFGKLKKVNGSFWISYHDKNSSLCDLNDVEEVGGSLLLRGFPIITLSKLKKVGGILNLRGTKIEDLGALEFVGEHVYLPKSKRDYFNFDKIYVGGKIKYFSS